MVSAQHVDQYISSGLSAAGASNRRENDSLLRVKQIHRDHLTHSQTKWSIFPLIYTRGNGYFFTEEHWIALPHTHTTHTHCVFHLVPKHSYDSRTGQNASLSQNKLDFSVCKVMLLPLLRWLSTINIQFVIYFFYLKIDIRFYAGAFCFCVYALCLTWTIQT